MRTRHIGAAAVLWLLAGCGGTSSSAVCGPPKVDASPSSSVAGGTIEIVAAPQLDGCDDTGEGETRFVDSAAVFWEQDGSRTELGEVSFRSGPDSGRLSVVVPADAVPGDGLLIVGSGRATVRVSPPG